MFNFKEESFRKIIKTSIRLSHLGFLLFLVFYAIAALNYPGGSYMHPNKEGFSFFENYLCDLLDEHALNGILNSGKIYARIALGFLCLGIFLFWFHLPVLFHRKNSTIKVMRISGMLSMIVTILLAADNHDIVTRIAGLFGAIAVGLALIELYKAGLKNFFYFGVFCLLIFLLNYYSYETGVLRSFLPIFQKITTIACLCWFGLLNLKLHKQVNLNMK